MWLIAAHIAVFAIEKGIKRSLEKQTRGKWRQHNIGVFTHAGNICYIASEGYHTLSMECINTKEEK